MYGVLREEYTNLLVLLVVLTFWDLPQWAPVSIKLIAVLEIFVSMISHKCLIFQ